VPGHRIGTIDAFLGLHHAVNNVDITGHHARNASARGHRQQWYAQRVRSLM